MNSVSQSAPAAARLWLLLIGGGLLLALTQFRLHYLVTVVVGTSMQPTFVTGDLLVVDKRANEVAEPQRGDVVVCRSGPDLLVKRVVSLPGEELEMVHGTLLVNGLPLREPYVANRGGLSISRGQVPEDKVIVMGDNRDLSPYSFIFAAVPVDDILGKVVYSLSLRTPPWHALESLTGDSHFQPRKGTLQNALETVKPVSIPIQSPV